VGTSFRPVQAAHGIGSPARTQLGEIQTKIAEEVGTPSGQAVASSSFGYEAPAQKLVGERYPESAREVVIARAGRASWTPAGGNR
jgi:hypothetical protein